SYWRRSSIPMFRSRALFAGAAGSRSRARSCRSRRRGCARARAQDALGKRDTSAPLAGKERKPIEHRRYQLGARFGQRAWSAFHAAISALATAPGGIAEVAVAARVRE